MRLKFGCFAHALTLFVAALTLTAPPGRAAGLLVADNGFGGQLEVKEHAVRVTINNGVAVTEVTQVFQNTEDRVVEALYTFPVPRGASVSNFSMWINGKEMTGEVVEKQRARQIYESYKAKRRDPGLLEQVDYRTFEMRVFPIAPRAEQKVMVTYEQELDFDHDWATYVYPLATNARNAPPTRAGVFSFNVDVKSEIPIVAIESPSHADDFAIAKHADSYQQGSLELRDGDLNRDVVLAYHVTRPHTGIDVITSKQAGEDGYLMLTLAAGEELPQKDAAMDYVFVLDISGSMNDEGKLDLSRQAVGAFVNALSPQDRFEVMTFNVRATTGFGKLRTADDAAKKDAESFLDSQDARGGTVLNPAVSAAYRYAEKDRPLNVVILSDGLTEQNERTQLVSLIGARPAGSRVFCIGVGNDVNRGLLEQLATNSGGLAAFLSRDDNLQRQAAAFRRKLLRPIATDVKIAIAGNGVEVYDVEPKQLPNLYHGAPIRMYARYKGDGPVKVNLSGKVLDQPISDTLSVDLPKADATNPQIERMWAWKKVDRLLKEADANGSRASVVDDVVRLGEAYSIATEYTSFIVLENDAEYQRWKIDQKNALRVARDREAQARVAERLEQMRNRAAEAIGPGMPDADRAAQEKVADASVAKPQAAAPVNAPAPMPASDGRSRGRDFNIPMGGGGGGGAIDPISGSIAIGVGLVALGTLRRKGGPR